MLNESENKTINLYYEPVRAAQDKLMVIPL